MSFFNFNTISAKIGVQIYREAQKIAEERGNAKSARIIAERMINRFAANMLEAIDADQQFKSTKIVTGIPRKLK